MIALDEGARQKLIKEVAAILKQSDVAGDDGRGRATPDFTKLDSVLQTFKTSRRNVENVFKDADILSTFVRDWLERNPRETAPLLRLLGSPSGSSTSLDSSDERTAQQIIEEFQSSPFTYRLSVVLPEQLSEKLAVEESRNASGVLYLQPVSENFQKEFDVAGLQTPANRGGLFSALDGTFEWTADRVAVQLQADGFVDLQLGTHTAHELLEDLRALIAMSFAAGLINEQPFHWIVNPWRPMKAIIHRRVAGAWKAHRAFGLPVDINSALASAEWAVEGTPSDRSKMFNRLLSKIFQRGDEARRVRRAATWLAKSQSSSDHLFSIIAAVVALEILYKASESKNGTKHLLADRCAYSLGRTTAQRTSISGDIAAAYELRSAIIHHGESRPSRDAVRTLGRLQEICKGALRSELMLLEAKGLD